MFLSQSQLDWTIPISNDCIHTAHCSVAMPDPCLVCGSDCVFTVKLKLCPKKIYNKASHNLCYNRLKCSKMNVHHNHRHHHVHHQIASEKEIDLYRKWENIANGISVYGLYKTNFFNLLFNDCICWRLGEKWWWRRLSYIVGFVISVNWFQ